MVLVTTGEMIFSTPLIPNNNNKETCETGKTSQDKTQNQGVMSEWTF